MQIARNRNLVLKKDLKKRKLKKKTLLKKRDPDPDPDPESAFYWHPTFCVRLATMLRCVATCWVLLAQVWKWSNLGQQHPTSRNMSQQGGQTHATCLRPTMLRYVELACCDRLAWALYRVMNMLISDFKDYQGLFWMPFKTTRTHEGMWDI